MAWQNLDTDILDEFRQTGEPPVDIDAAMVARREVRRQYQRDWIRAKRHISKVLVDTKGMSNDSRIKGAPLTPELLSQLREAIEREGIGAVAARLRCSRNCLLQAVSGFRVYRGTHALCETLGGPVSEVRPSCPLPRSGKVA